MSRNRNTNPRADLQAAAAKMFSVDLRSLAILRVVLGLLVIADVLGRWSSIDVLYTDNGVLPRTLLNGSLSTWEWSVFKLTGGSELTTLLMGATVLTALVMVAGFQTRVATVLVWVLLVSLQVRNPLVLSGADILLRVVMFWAMLLPIGRVWSFDSWRRRAVPPPVSMRFVSVASAGLILQIACMYWFTAWLKSGPTWRTEGTALFYATGMEDLTRPFGEFLHGYPEFLRVATHVSLGFEFLIPFLFFSPWFHDRLRLVAVGICMAFHAGIWLMMDVGLFPFVSAFCMVGLLPTSFWDRAVPWIRGRAGKVVTAVPQTASATLQRSPLLNVFAAGCMGLIFFWNLAGVTPLTRPREVQAAGYVLALDQGWTMFAPNPTRSTEWQIVGGLLADFTSVNLLPSVVGSDFSTSVPYTIEQPDNIVTDYYHGKYWRKYFDHISIDENKAEQLAFADYVCSSWNRQHEGSERLTQVSLMTVRVRTLPDGERGDPAVSVVSSFGCR